MTLKNNAIYTLAEKIAREEPSRGREDVRETVDVAVTSVRQNGRYVEIRLAPPSSVRATHRMPGQYVVATLSDGEPRFLVLANPPGQAWSLLVEPAPELVEALAVLKSGDSITVSHAEGPGYPSVADVERLVIFASGSGIASVKGVLEHLTQMESPPDTHLYYGESAQPDFAYHTDLRALHEKGLVRVSFASGGAYVQDLYDHESVELHNGLVFICGSPAMMQAVASDLMSRGIRADQIATNI